MATSGPLWDGGLQHFLTDRDIFGPSTRWDFRAVLALRLKYGLPVTVVTVRTKPGQESGWERTHPDCMSRASWLAGLASGDIKRSPSGYYARVRRADYGYGY